MRDLTKPAIFKSGTMGVVGNAGTGTPVAPVLSPVLHFTTGNILTPLGVEDMPAGMEGQNFIIRAPFDGFYYETRFAWVTDHWEVSAAGPSERSIPFETFSDGSLSIGGDEYSVSWDGYEPDITPTTLTFDAGNVVAVPGGITNRPVWLYPDDTFTITEGSFAVEMVAGMFEMTVSSGFLPNATGSGFMQGARAGTVPHPVTYAGFDAPSFLWQSFSLTAAAIGGVVGYSDGASMTAGGSINQEPNPARPLQFLTYDAGAGESTARFYGDVTDDIGVWIIDFDGTEYDLGSATYDAVNDWTDAVYPDLVISAGVHAVEFREAAPPLPGYRYWGMRVTQGGSQPENQIMEFVVSTTPGNPEANAITSGSQFGWSPSAPTGVTGSFDNLIDGGTTSFLRFNKASATGKVIYADMGAPIEPEFMAIHPGSSTYRLASVQAVASNDGVTWTDMASSVTTNLNTYITIYTAPP